MDKLITLGWTPESAAMAAGNAQAESNINASGPAGDHGASVGMFQDQGSRRTALRAFQARHPEMSAEDSNIAFYDQERQQRARRHVTDMSRAGAFSHATEGYGDATEGKRVRMSHDGGAALVLFGANWVSPSRPLEQQIDAQPHTIVIGGSVGH